MIEIKPNEAMNRAVERAKQHHPRVQIVNAGQRIYRVSGSNGANYVVRFAVNGSRKFAACECQAGQAGRLCYHVASAAAVNIGVALMRERERHEREQAVLVKLRPKGETYGGIDI